MKRSRRWALGAALAAGTLVLLLVISGWDQIQAWRLILGETVTILPDPSLTADTVEGSLQVHPPLRSKVCCFQAKTLLRFLATRSGRPVILRSSGKNALETWIEIDPREPRTPITSEAVLPLLRSRGWRIVEQPLSSGAYVVLSPPEAADPFAARSDEDTEATIYDVGDLIDKVEKKLWPDTLPDRFVVDDLGTLIVETTGGSDVWMEPNSIVPDRRTRSIVAVAPRRVHRRIQRVLEALRLDNEL